MLHANTLYRIDQRQNRYRGRSDLDADLALIRSGDGREAMRGFSRGQVTSTAAERRSAVHPP